VPEDNFWLEKMLLRVLIKNPCSNDEAKLFDKTWMDIKLYINETLGHEGPG